jgi:hypothetical protein
VVYALLVLGDILAATVALQKTLDCRKHFTSSHRGKAHHINTVPTGARSLVYIAHTVTRMIAQKAAEGFPVIAPAYPDTFNSADHLTMPPPLFLGHFTSHNC